MPTIGSGITIGSGVSMIDPTPIQGDLPLVIYDAGNPISYSGSGSTWSDLAGRNNNATLINSPTFNSSGTSSSFVFNGSNQYGSLDPAKLNTTYTGKTVIVAARMDVGYTAVPTYRAFFGASTGARTFNFYVQRDATGFRLHWSAGPTSGFFGSFSSYLSLSTNQWFIAGVTHEIGGAVTYYLNNTAVGTATQTFTQWISGDANVGRADNYWWGDLPFAAVFGSSLTTDQLTYNFNYLKGRYGIT